MSTLSAKGHRLNKRGRQTRQAVIDVAVRLLAAGGPEVSANLVAKEAVRRVHHPGRVAA